ncbi:hypothetical protein BV20DRAFT_959460, partial [Pilatotrama ljubarskyi]
MSVQLTHVDYAQWTEGVEEYKHLTIEDIIACFALESPRIPIFADKVDMHGIEDPWSPGGQRNLTLPGASELRLFWHQWIACLKMADAMFEGRNILLMDGVGVGKTIEATATIGLYEWLRVYRKQRGAFPMRFGESAPRPRCSMSQADLTDNMHVIVVPPPLMEQWVTEIKRYLHCRVVSVIPYVG